ncbi:hypothetical protein D9611_010928 [Ephemerocybe angulata]|uniref:Uncharacterized protein n=1 Tax=Ephemerocybe angulata TaxID=980116 RepID=A0A8H5C6U4_9AGAR|nr:hypothetical protein D9611_010928 [Tulosesus angulatus]
MCAQTRKAAQEANGLFGRQTVLARHASTDPCLVPLHAESNPPDDDDGPGAPERRNKHPGGCECLHHLATTTASHGSTGWLVESTRWDICEKNFEFQQGFVAYLAH